MQKIVSIAPMIDFTNSHFRTFTRLLTKRAIVYTEMVHMNAVVHNHEKVLPFSEIQHPIALQIGGNCPETLHKAAQIAASYGYDSINFNVGCPSKKVQSGCFGAVLMKDSKLVKQCMKAIKEGGKLPVSVKCRLGVDDDDSYEFASNFIRQISQEGQGPLNHFIIHARKVYLKGLSPVENRTVPPLMYDRVYQLKTEFPSVFIQINGGIDSIAEGFNLVHDNNLDGCMIGRLALSNPFQLLKIDDLFYRESHELQQFQDPTIIRYEILQRYSSYLQKLQKGEIRDQKGRVLKLSTKFVLFRPILNLYKGQLWGCKFRQNLSDMTVFRDRLSSEIIREMAEWITNQTRKTRAILNTSSQDISQSIKREVSDIVI